MIDLIIRVAEICRILQWEVDVGNIKSRKKGNEII